MKKLILSAFFVGVGALAWLAVSQTASFSFKKWDSTLSSALSQGLREMGLSDADIFTQVHKIMKDDKGQWVAQTMSIQLPKGKDLAALKKSLEEAGAEVQEKIEGAQKRLIIKRGNRVFQEILVEPK